MNKKLILAASLLCPFYGYADVALQIGSDALTSWNIQSTGTNDFRIYNSEQTITINSNQSGLIYDIGPSSAGSYFAHITVNLTDPINYDSDTNTYLYNRAALATALGVSSSVLSNSVLSNIQPSALSSDTFFTPFNFGYFGKELTLNAGTTYKFYWSMANGDYTPYTDGSFMALSQGGNLTSFNLLGRVSRYGAAPNGTHYFLLQTEPQQASLVILDTKVRLKFFQVMVLALG